MTHMRTVSIFLQSVSERSALVWNCSADADFSIFTYKYWFIIVTMSFVWDTFLVEKGGHNDATHQLKSKVIVFKSWNCVSKPNLFSWPPNFCRQHDVIVYRAWLRGAALLKLCVRQLVDSASFRDGVDDNWRQREVSNDACLQRILTQTVLYVQR